MKSITPFVLAAVLAGCATPNDAPVADASTETQTEDAREVAFTCDNGETLRVRFEQTPAQAVLIRNGAEIVLPQQPSGSGFVYGTPRQTIRGKGDALTVEIGRMAPIQCTAVR